MRKSQKGFTLIELLIVIVIIGILAGVLIAIIDPTSQQNRARDAGLQAAINKVALATQGFISAYGNAPNDTEFFNAIANAAEMPAGACVGAVADTQCYFDITGNLAPTLCLAANDYNTDGNAKCAYYYEQDYQGAGTDTFVIVVRTYGVAGKSFVYKNDVGEMEICDYDDYTANCTTP